MYAFEMFLAVVAIAMIAFQAWVTSRVVKSKLFDSKQKLWQIHAVWLVPILGAGMVFSVLREEERDARPRTSQLSR